MSDCRRAFSDSIVKQREDMRPHSRGAMRPSFAVVFTLEKQEGAGKTGCALHPRSRVQKATVKNAHEHTGSAEAVRPSLRNGFTAYAAISSATNSACHRRCRLDGSSNPVGSISPPTAWHQQRVSGPRGFAV